GSFDRARGSTFNNGGDAQNRTGRAADTTTRTSTDITNTNGQTSGSTNAGSVTATAGTPTSTSTTGTTGGLTSSTTATTGNGVTSLVTDTANNALNLLNTIAYTGATNRTAQAVFSADEFRLVLSALQTQNDVKVVSNPTIVTLNNVEASINVGEETPIPNYAYNQERGSFEVNGFTWKQIGIILKVTPQVNARGSIKLTLAPEVSQRNGETTFGGAGGATIPIVATRKAITQVSLKDGYTMGIGGLLSTQSTKGMTKVPVLGSVPVLGRLFRSDSRDSQVNNLIIFITAKTLSADGAPIEQVFESERVRSLQLRREDLPGHRDGSSPFVPDAVPMPMGPRSGAAPSNR
ncbi:MAG: type II and III secretion system protein, partial [Opitutaceae bacterium]|nr:type II and III secretion system protein [Opitutaceae bacterium]